MTTPSPSPRQAGFTLVEVLVTVAIVALLLAMVVPNLGALVPSARLHGSGTQIQRRLDWARSEARIQGKRMVLEFDLDKARYRVVFPPEQRLTRDQDERTLQEQPMDDWYALETDVVFAAAGDGRAGAQMHGLYRIVFDEYGFTADQMIALKLTSDPDQTWSLSIHGLSGRVTILESEKGELPVLQVIGEGAF